DDEAAPLALLVRGHHPRNLADLLADRLVALGVRHARRPGWFRCVWSASGYTPRFRERKTRRTPRGSYNDYVPARLKGSEGPTMQSSMSDVETLLSVDAGRVPPGTVAFFARDPEQTQRRVLAVFAMVVGVAAAAAYLGGLSRPPTALLAL